MAGSQFYSSIPHPVGTSTVRDPAQWGGHDRSLHTTNGYDATYVPGSSGQEQDVARYREMGAAPGQAAKIQTGNINESRGLQMGGLNDTRDAMGLARGAAMGTAPSAAETYGGKLIDDSINSQMAMAGSARGGPSAMAGAQRQAAFQGVQTQQAGARDLAGMRASEMANARDQYGGLANAYGNQVNNIRGQDFQQAYGQAGLNNDAMGREQQNQQYYEGLGWNTNEAAMRAELQRREQESQGWYRGQQAKQQGARDSWGKIKDVANMGAGLIGSMFSDVRAKEDIYPVGGGGDGLIRENPYGADNIIRENPYGNAPPAKASAQPSAGMALLRGLGAGLQGFAGSGAYLPIKSDENTKYGIGPADATFDKLGGGGLDVLGSLKAHSDFGTQFQRNAGSGPSMIRSDDRAKLRAAYLQGQTDAGSGSKPAYPPLGENEILHTDGDQSYISEDSAKDRNAMARYNAGRERVSEAGMYGGNPGLIDLTPLGQGANMINLGRGLAARHFGVGVNEEPEDSPKQQPAPRDPGYDDERRAAETYGGADSIRRAPGAPADDPIANANRAQEASSYIYKPAFAAEAGQAPGERNIGPMAQTMAQDPIAATAVKEGPDGLLALDSAKLQKLHSAGIASLQKQLDELARNSTRERGGTGFAAFEDAARRPQKRSFAGAGASGAGRAR